MGLPMIAQDIDMLVKALYTEKNIEIIRSAKEDARTSAIKEALPLLREEKKYLEGFVRYLDNPFDKSYHEETELYRIWFGDYILSDKAEIHHRFSLAKEQVSSIFQADLISTECKFCILPEYNLHYVHPKNIATHIGSAILHPAGYIFSALSSLAVGTFLSVEGYNVLDTTYFSLAAYATSLFLLASENGHCLKDTLGEFDPNCKKISLKKCLSSKTTNILRHEYTHFLNFQLCEEQIKEQHPTKEIFLILLEGIATFAQTRPLGTALEKCNSFRTLSYLLSTPEDFTYEKRSLNDYMIGISLMTVLHTQYGQDALNRLIRGDLTPLEGL